MGMTVLAYGHQEAKVFHVRQDACPAWISGLRYGGVCVCLTLPERRVCGLFIEAEKKPLTINLTLNLRCPGSVC